MEKTIPCEKKINKIELFKLNEKSITFYFSTGLEFRGLIVWHISRKYAHLSRPLDKDKPGAPTHQAPAIFNFISLIMNKLI